MPVANDFHPISLISPVQLSPTSSSTAKTKTKTTPNKQTKTGKKNNWEKADILQRCLKSSQLVFGSFLPKATLSVLEEAE